MSVTGRADEGRNMKPSNMKECFYTPGRPGIIDVVNDDTKRGHYGGKTLEETRAEHPDAVVGDFDQVVDDQANYWRRAPVEITEEQFNEMLNCLPPVGWVGIGGDFESFKMCELDAANITGIYCRLGSRYFELHDDRYMRPNEIRALVDAAFPTSGGPS